VKRWQSPQVLPMVGPQTLNELETNLRQGFLGVAIDTTAEVSPF
jgi:hypothetical protein